MAATLNFKFVANEAGLKTGINNAQSSMTGLQKHAEGVSSKMKAAFGAIGFAVVAKGLYDATKAAAEDKISSDLLANSLKNNAKATDTQVAAVEKSIGAMSRQFGVADDKLRPAFSKLATMTGDTSKAQDLLKLAMDASAATGKPLEATTTALGKAYQGNFGALQKLGIPMLDSVKNAKDLTTANKDLEKKQLDYNAAIVQYGSDSKEAKTALEKIGIAQEKVNVIAQQGTDWQKDLGAAFKGAAEKGTDPMKRLQIVFDELKETIGAALLPVISKLAELLIPIVDKIAQVLGKLIGALAPIFLKLVEVLLPLIEDILPVVISLLEALMPVIEPIVEILKILLVPIVKLLGEVLKGVLGFIKPVLDAFAGFARKIPEAFNGVGQFFKGLVNGYIGIWEGFINFFIDGINMIPKALNKIHVKLPDWMGGAEVGFKIPTASHIKIPRLAKGGIVMPSPGGSLVNVAEAGKAEAIIPLDRLGGMGGNTYNININKASITGEEIVQAIRRYEISRGRTVAF